MTLPKTRNRLLTAPTLCCGGQTEITREELAIEGTMGKTMPLPMVI
jgi:hypothetical protein